MKNINENISDETIKDVYKSAFKERSITIKDFKIEHDDENSTDYFHIITPLGIHFWVKWHSNINIAYFISVVNEEESDMKTIKNPNANILVDYIALEYKKLVKKQNILKQILSLILENDYNSSQNPLLRD